MISEWDVKNNYRKNSVTCCNLGNSEGGWIELRSQNRKGRELKNKNNSILKINNSKMIPEKAKLCFVIWFTPVFWSASWKIQCSDWSKFSHSSVWKKYTENLQHFKNAYCSGNWVGYALFFGKKLEIYTFMCASPTILIFMATVQK